MLTEEQHIKLVVVGDKFWNDLGKLAGKAISQFPPEIQDEVTCYLQDKCSIYGTDYEKHIKR